MHMATVVQFPILLQLQPWMYIYQRLSVDAWSSRPQLPRRQHCGGTTFNIATQFTTSTTSKPKWWSLVAFCILLLFFSCHQLLFAFVHYHVCIKHNKLPATLSGSWKAISTGTGVNIVPCVFPGTPIGALQSKFNMTLHLWQVTYCPLAMLNLLLRSTYSCFMHTCTCKKTYK